jgi:hypothetical protein
VNGDPVVGAVLKVYDNGTTDYRDIYFDDGLSNAAPNPLTGAYSSDAGAITSARCLDQSAQGYHR